MNNVHRANVTVTDLEDLQPLLQLNIKKNQHLIRTGSITAKGRKCRRISPSSSLYSDGRLHLLWAVCGATGGDSETLGWTRDVYHLLLWAAHGWRKSWNRKEILWATSARIPVRGDPTWETRPRVQQSWHSHSPPATKSRLNGFICSSVWNDEDGLGVFVFQWTVVVLVRCLTLNHMNTNCF